MTRALIADDEPQLARYLSKQLGQLWPELEIVHIAKNGIEAAAKIAELQPELAFLDIQMPGLSGLEVAQGIEGSTRVVFVTAYDEYAVQAFEQAALDYLLKPLSTERLTRTLQRVKAALALQPSAMPDFPDARFS
jgi:DNA-binding LytR/AlgR family response regulator